MVARFIRVIDVALSDQNIENEYKKCHRISPQFVMKISVILIIQVTHRGINELISVSRIIRISRPENSHMMLFNAFGVFNSPWNNILICRTSGSSLIELNWLNVLPLLLSAVYMVSSCMLPFSVKVFYSIWQYESNRIRGTSCYATYI